MHKAQQEPIFFHFKSQNFSRLLTAPLIDPRIFMISPEHVSNAHHIWKYALFISQMSNLSSLDSASLLTKRKSINQTSAYSNTALRKDSELKIKRQIKASLFNLILPPALSIESVDHSQGNSPTLKTINTTFISSTPWIVEEKLGEDT